MNICDGDVSKMRFEIDIKDIEALISYDNGLEYLEKYYGKNVGMNYGL